MLKTLRFRTYNPLRTIDPTGTATMHLTGAAAQNYFERLKNEINSKKDKKREDEEEEEEEDFERILGNGGGKKSNGTQQQGLVNESFGSGFVDGFGRGIGSTVDFFSSLGTTQGWIDLGQGMLDLATLGCQICPEGMIMRNQLADRTASYIQSIPDMSVYEMGYDLGFGTEKALEVALTRRVYTGSGVGVNSVRMLSNTSKRGTTLFKTGKNFRIDLDIKNGLHYHRRGPGGIGRHRPWQVKPGDKGDFWKRF